MSKGFFAKLREKLETSPAGDVKSTVKNKNPFLPILEKHLPTSDHLKVSAAKLGFIMTIIYADLKVDDNERIIFEELVTKYLSVGKDKAHAIATELFAVDQSHLQMTWFTQVLRDYSDESQIKKFLSDLFKVAWVDGDYDIVEERDIRIICKYLFISHKDFIAARIAAKKNHKS